MEELNAEKIKKLKLGETCGNIAVIFCGALLAAFIACFSVAQVSDIYVLRIVSLSVFPALLAVCAALAAYCNLKFGRALNAEIKRYVKDVLIENAPLMHPDRESLAFAVSVGDSSAEIKVNNFKETIKFDFSAFGKLSLARKSAVGEAIAEKLNATFCRLYERGARYNSVSYYRTDGRKKSKAVCVIENGEPDKRAFKMYLKTN